MPPLPDALTLRGNGIVLRDWRESDAAALEPACGDPEICTFSSVPWIYSAVDARAWISRFHERRAAGQAIALAITPGADGAPVGNVNLVRFSADGRAAALGYWLVRGARGQGLASAAARLLCAWAFDQLALERIELAILPDNLASHRVADQLGATREGIRRDSHEAAGRLWDMVIYGLHAVGDRP